MMISMSSLIINEDIIMAVEFNTQKTLFINLINQKFEECAATGKTLEPSIKGSLDIYLPKLNSIESMKNVVCDYFSEPSDYDTGSVCSELFMGAIESFSVNDGL